MYVELISFCSSDIYLMVLDLCNHKNMRILMNILKALFVIGFDILKSSYPLQS